MGATSTTENDSQVKCCRAKPNAIAAKDLGRNDMSWRLTVSFIPALRWLSSLMRLTTEANGCQPLNVFSSSSHVRSRFDKMKVKVVTLRAAPLIFSSHKTPPPRVKNRWGTRYVSLHPSQREQKARQLDISSKRPSCVCGPAHCYTTPPLAPLRRL